MHLIAPSAAAPALLRANRILVIGPSGAGKTKLAMRLAERLGLPVIHLDALFWQPGWLRTPRSAWRAVVAELVRAERWIMDGTYEDSLDLRLPAADAVIVLERGRWGCLWAVISRSVRLRGWLRPDAPAGQPLDRSFLRYVWRHGSDTRPVVTRSLRAYGDGVDVVQLTSREEVRSLLHELSVSPSRS